jgi:hypothetical protein
MASNAIASLASMFLSLLAVQLSQLTPRLVAIPHQPPTLLIDCHTGVFLYALSMGRIESAAPDCCSSVVAMGTCLFVKPLLSNGCCIYTYSEVII